MRNLDWGKILRWPLIERYSFVELIWIIQLLDWVRDGSWGYALLGLVLGAIIIALTNVGANMTVYNFLHHIKAFNRNLRREQSAVAPGDAPRHTA